MARFEAKRVLVTGAAAGFGEAIARGFAAEGARVLVTDIDEAGAKRVSESLRGALSCRLDVTDEVATKAAVELAVAEWGGLDIVCPNAGLPHMTMPLIDLPTEDFDRTFAVNTRSVYFAAKYAVPHLSDGGSIISTASIGGLRPRPGLTAYNASKGAVVTLTRGLAAELAPKIRVCCVTPVSAPTGFDKNAVGIASLPEPLEAQIVAGIPMGRRAEASDVANAILFLASDDARFLTGVCLDVDGGRSIQ